MPTYKLMYYNGRGRAEVIRMLFAEAETMFEDQRIENDDWPKHKGDTPQDAMPVLEVDGNWKICQSMAIARHLAREFSLYGANNREKVMIDQITDTVLDMFDPFVKAMFTPVEEEKKKLMEKFKTEQLPKFLCYLQELVKQAGKDGFSVGQSLTLSDLTMYTYIEMIGGDKLLDKFPQLAENRKTVAELPRIKAYLEKRPKSDW